VNKDLRTLNNVTGLFDGGCVRNGWQDATDIVIKAGPAVPRLQWQAVVDFAVNLWTA
jgi:hypothetical protein